MNLRWETDKGKVILFSVCFRINLFLYLNYKFIIYYFLKTFCWSLEEQSPTVPRHLLKHDKKWHLRHDKYLLPFVFLSINLSLNAYAYIYVHTHMCVGVYVYIYLYMYIYLYAHIYTLFCSVARWTDIFLRNIFVQRILRDTTLFIHTCEHIY